MTKGHVLARAPSVSSRVQWLWCFFRKWWRFAGIYMYKAILRHFCKTLFQNFEPFLANRASKFQKSANITLKLFLHKTWIWVSKKLKILRWFRNCWEKCKKFANNKVTGKRSVQNWSFYSSLLLTCKSFWQITFSRYTFFKLFPWIWNQHKILRFLDTHMLKKK